MGRTRRYLGSLVCLIGASVGCGKSPVEEGVANDVNRPEVSQPEDASRLEDYFQTVIPTATGGAYVVSGGDVWFVDGERLMPLVAAKAKEEFSGPFDSEPMPDGSLVCIDSHRQLWRVVREQATKIEPPGWDYDSEKGTIVDIEDSVHPMPDGSAILHQRGLLWRLVGGRATRITLDGKVGQPQDFVASFQELETLRIVQKLPRTGCDCDAYRHD